MASSFSGLIAAGITNGMDGKAGILAWRWLFIIEGTATVVIAMAAFFILPDLPKNTSWLTDTERDLATWRLELDIGEKDWEGDKNEQVMRGLKLAFADPKTYIFTVFVFGITASGSVTNFFPTVVATLGYGRIKSLLLTCPPYALCVITSLANAYHADKTGERYFHITLPLWINVASFLLAAVTTATTPRYIAMMLMVPSLYSGYVVALAWISNTLPRPPAKRASAIAAINAIAHIASIYSSYMYPKSAGPRYLVAMVVNACTALMAIAAATLLRVILVRLNKKLENGEHVRDVADGEESISEGNDRGAVVTFRFLV